MTSSRFINDVTELHSFLRGRDSNRDVVRAIISASPDILCEANSIGWNALHVAASVGWNDDEWLLQNAMSCNVKRPLLSDRTHNGGHSCISLFFRHHVDPLPWHDDEVKEAASVLRGYLADAKGDATLLEACRSRLILKEKDMQNVTASDAVNLIVAFWRRMELWLCAVSSQRNEPFSVLRALANAGGCPKQVAQVAVILYLEQASTRDDEGSLPLHILCSSETANKDDCQSLLQALLSCYPEAAQCANQAGRLPLNVALACGKGGEFIQKLLAAEPRVVLMGTRDVISGLPSFALAASAPTLETHLYALNMSDVGSLWHFLPPHAQQERLERARRELEVIQLNTIYEILRAMPDAVQFGIS